MVLWWEAAVAKRYRVTLTGEEREALGGMISRGKAAARRLVHARVLLQADASEGGPDWTDTRIAEAVRVSVRTIWRVGQRFVEEGLEVYHRPHNPQRPVICLDECSKQLIGEVRTPLPPCPAQDDRPGRAERYDYQHA